MPIALNNSGNVSGDDTLARGRKGNLGKNLEEAVSTAVSETTRNLRKVLVIGSLAALTCASVACGGQSMVAAIADSGASSNSNSESSVDEERKLPQGVIAPFEPVQPGDARLGADGYYDYTAADFVLRHPCDDQELMAKLKDKGWEVSPGISARTDNPFVKGCVLLPADTSELPIAVHAQKVTAKDAQNSGDYVAIKPKAGLNYFGSIVPSTAADMCFIGQDTSHGSIGLVYLYTPEGVIKTKEDSCAFVEKNYLDIFGGLQ